MSGLLFRRLNPIRQQRRNVEDGLQFACVTLLHVYEQQRMLRFFAVPNGERRDAKTGAKLKRMGVRPGVPDLVVLVRGVAMFIELKADTKTARLSKPQEQWRDWLLEHGHGWACVRSVDQLKEVVNALLYGVKHARAA